MQLLCTDRGGLGKSLYRAVLDFVEESTTNAANKILVNSYFTASIVQQTWPHLYAQHRETLEVLYPVVVVDHQDGTARDNTSSSSSHIVRQRPFYASSEHIEEVFVSLNRFERKKRIEVAVEAFALMCKRLRDARGDTTRRFLLVVAGGFDARVAENIEYLQVTGLQCFRIAVISTSRS